MDSSNWRSNQGGGGAIRESTMHSGDWRSLLRRSSRQRMINRIMVALKRHFPISGQEGIQELRKIAVRYEDKIYTSSTSRCDYLRTMSLKMQAMETRSQNPIPNAMQPYYGANIVNPFNPDSRAQMGNWTRSQGGSGSSDWRSELQADSRQRIVNKITDTFKRHLPFSGREGLLELNKIAEGFEEKIYTAATSQSDYLRKISLEMLTLETRSQNSMQLNSGANYSLNPSDPGSSSLSYALPPGTGLPQSGQNSSLQETFSHFGAQMGNWTCSSQGGSGSSMESGDWRSHLQPDSRERIVNKIMDTLKRHLPFSGQEGLQEINKIAVRFEENIYTCATSQSDYLRKISLKMLTMETRSQNPMQSSSVANYIANPSHPGNHHDE